MYNSLLINLSLLLAETNAFNIDEVLIYINEKNNI